MNGATALEYAAQATSKTSSSMAQFLSVINNDAHLQDPAMITETLCMPSALLQEKESMEAAYKSGHDLFLISTKDYHY